MSKGNGQADVSLEDQLKEEQLKDTKLKDEQNQTLENELPAADPADGFEEKSASGGDPQGAVATAGGELEKLRASATICLIGWRDCRLSLITIASARQKKMPITAITPCPMLRARCCR